MMRLAQIRDWLDGQAFADLVQQRLGPPGGTAMHWSRLPDLVPAALIRLLSPLIGVTRAEVAGVIFWPEILLLLHLWLTGALARKLGQPGAANAAIAVAALAFPAIVLFVPGRIDHHGLQIVLVEAMLLGLLSGRLVLAGLAAGTSLLVGVETAPVILAAMAGLCWFWVAGRPPVTGFGIGIGIASLTGLALLRPEPWLSQYCDGFTPPIAIAMLAGGGGWIALGLLTPRLPDRGWRIGAAAVLAALAFAAVWLAAPACLSSPYGPTDAVLDRLWPGQAGEYGGLPAQPLGRAIAWAGLPLVGFIGALVYWRRAAERREPAILFLLMIGTALIGSVFQLRSLWFAAALAAPVLAQLISGLRKRGMAWQAAAWIVSAGLVWQAVGALAVPAQMEAEASCADRETLAALDRLDTGSFAAPMDMSASIIGATQHRSLAGPYHRNLRGNRAMADLFQTSPEEARYQASLWAVDYVALCPSSTGGLPSGMLKAGGLATHLIAGAPPAWLDPVPLVGSDLLVWRVQPVAAPGIRP